MLILKYLLIEWKSEIYDFLYTFYFRQRQNTEDFDLEDDNRYGTSRSSSQAVQA